MERCVITLVDSLALMLVGEPGTAKSMIAELLAAAISGSSELTVRVRRRLHRFRGLLLSRCPVMWTSGVPSCSCPTE